MLSSIFLLKGLHLKNNQNSKKMDLFEKVKERAKTADLGKYQAGADGYFMFPKLEGEIGPEMNFRTPFGVKPILNWSLNNYLGLANDPEVRKADAEGAAQYGLAAPMGARMMSGQTVYHEELEAMLAASRSDTEDSSCAVTRAISSTPCISAISAASG